MISFIIPAHQEQEHIALTVQSILKNSWSTPPEIIVVENGSTDQTAQRARSAGATTYSLSEKNRSKARNFGVSKSSGSWIVFLDADVLLDPNWSKSFYKALETAWYDVIQGPIISSSPTDTFLNRFRYEYNREKTQGTFCSLYTHAPIPVLNSACFAVKRSFFESASGFNEELERCEDLDFGLRLLFEGAIFRTESSMMAYVYWNHSFWSYLARFYKQGSAFRKLEDIWSVNLTAHGDRMLMLKVIKERYGCLKLIIHTLQLAGWLRENSLLKRRGPPLSSMWVRQNSRNLKLPFLWGWKTSHFPNPGTTFLFTQDFIKVFYLNRERRLRSWVADPNVAKLEDTLNESLTLQGFQKKTTSF